MQPQKAGFTFLEILIVLGLIGVVFAAASLNFSGGRARITNAAYQFTQDIQGLYAESIKTGRIHRILFSEAKDSYTLDVFEMPRPKPKGDDRKALEKWEKEQEQINETLRDRDKYEITRIDRGLFRSLKKRDLNSNLRIKSFVKASDLKNNKKDSPAFILFYPSGETDQVLIVLEDTSERSFSLLVDALSGRVKTVPGELSVDQWKKDLGIK